MIYFIRDEATQFIKIGVTVGDVEDRRRTLQTGCPGNLVVLFQMEGSEQDEATWHERFANVRDRGEWFRPVPELLLAIMEAKVLHLEAENTRLLELLAAEWFEQAVIESQSTKALDIGMQSMLGQRHDSRRAVRRGGSPSASVAQPIQPPRCMVCGGDRRHVHVHQDQIELCRTQGVHCLKHARCHRRATP